MTEQNPYQQLGVKETASFEEIQMAKVRLEQKYRFDSKVLTELEAAYDAIIMDRLKQRQEGKIKVPDPIRFAEKYTPQTITPPPTVNHSPSWLTRLIDSPNPKELLHAALVFVVLSCLSLFDTSTTGNLLPLLLALGFAASLYFINRKELRFGRALLISSVSLLLGIVVGGFFGGILSTQLQSLNIAKDQLTSLFTFFLFWFVSSFLR